MFVGPGLALLLSLSAQADGVSVASHRSPDEAGPCKISVDYVRFYKEDVERALAGLADHEALCTFLKGRGLKVVLKATSGVLEGRAYAWAVISLADVKSDVEVGGYETVTLLGSPADSVEERRLFAMVVAESLASLAENPAKFISAKPGGDLG